jgi:shikimate dehydrogenase
VHLKSETVAADIRDMARAYSGINVTLPHKIAALEASANSSPEARVVGAANTLVRAGDGWTAHNTDVAGFEIAMRAVAGEELQNLRVLLIGAGGAARAVVVSLNRAGAQLTIANRSAVNAAALANELAPQAVTAGLSEVDALSASADIIVNSASLGHAGASLPLLAPGKGRPFLDLSYGKAAAATLQAAASAGWAPHDGLTMLVGQAAAAFHLWFGVAPDQARALAACRAAVAART